MDKDWSTWLLPLLSGDMQQGLKPFEDQPITEIRLRRNGPMEVVIRGEGKLVYAPNGRPMLPEGEEALLLSRLCGGAPYAWEQQLMQGFVTLPNGCRVGICGRIHPDTGQLVSITGFCIRMARQVIGCGERVVPKLLQDGRLRSTLIFSPPGGGKTTLLRDCIRLLSSGLAGAKPHRVGVVDERFELWGQDMGLNLGPRTDVLAGISKPQGLLRLLSTMGPQVLAADELYSPEDAAAVLEAKSRGVEVICTAHGGSYADLISRKGLGDLLQTGVFSRLVEVKNGGQTMAILDGEGNTP